MYLTFTLTVNPVQPFSADTFVRAIGVLTHLGVILTVERPRQTLVNIWGVNK